jgi:hypothetical protein
MSKFLVTACAFGLLLSFASAQEAEEELKAWKEGLVKREINRNVPSGKMWTVWWLAGANAECSPWIDVEVRTTKKPEHGTVEIVSDERIANFGKESGVAHCNGKKMPGLSVNYNSSGGYTGPDEFDLLVMLPSSGAGSSRGRDWEMHFNITVK